MAICGQSYARGRDTLLARLRADPGAPDALARYLDEHGPDLSEHDELMLWRFLAQAGTPEAQDVIARVLARRGFGARSADLALRHANQIPDAGAPVRDALWQLYDEAVAPADDLARSQHGEAVLALGALGHRDLASADTAEAVARGLERRVEGAPSAEERALLLSAVGNQGFDASRVWLGRYLADRDPETRAAAASAFRRMVSPEAEADLLASYARESDPGVRLAILSALAEMPSSPAVRDWRFASSGDRTHGCRWPGACCSAGTPPATPGFGRP